MRSNHLRIVSPRIADAWERASSRERRLIGLAGIAVTAALLWAAVWEPMQLDIARMERDQARDKSMLAAARAQVAEIASLQQAAPRTRSQDVRVAVERTIAGRGLRADVTTLDVQDGRVRLVFAAIRFEALIGALDALARGDQVRPAEMVLSARVEPGTVRAEIMFSR